MSAEPTSWPPAAKRGPIVITWDFPNRARVFFDARTQGQFQLAISSALEVFARRLDEATEARRKAWYSGHLDSARRLHTRIGPPGGGRLDLDNVEAQQMHDFLAALVMETTAEDGPRLLRALHELMLLAGEAYTIYLRRMPPLPGAFWKQGIPWEEDAPDNYLRMRATPDGTRCALSFGAVARLARWLSIIDPPAPVLQWLLRQLRRIARSHIRAQQRLEALL